MTVINTRVNPVSIILIFHMVVALQLHYKVPDNVQLIQCRELNIPR